MTSRTLLSSRPLLPRRRLLAAAAIIGTLSAACSSSSSPAASRDAAAGPDAHAKRDGRAADAACPSSPVQGEPCVASASCSPQTGSGCDVSFWTCDDGAWNAGHPPGCQPPTDSGSDAGCVENPVDGHPCTPGVTTCTAPPACGTQWACSPTDGGGGVWESFSSNCVLEDGGMPAGDGGHDKGHLDGSVAATSCSACGADELCIVNIQVGGAIATRGDGGAIICHNGGSGPNCTHQSFACANLPATCGATATCACASQLCTESYMCSASDSGLYSSGGPGPVLVCQQDDP